MSGSGPRFQTLSADEVTTLFADAAHGVYPAADWSVWVAPPCGPAAAVVAFTGCFLVTAPVDLPWWQRVLADPEVDPLHPRVLLSLAEHLGTTVGENDAVLVAPPALGMSIAPRVRLLPFDDGHPRVTRSRRFRDDVQAWTTAEGDGLLVLGRGLAGRWEMSMDVVPNSRARGLGRALASAARSRVPRGEPLFAQVTPGNAASMRALLAAGYRPIGQEVLFPLRRG
ncbi:N-acetyltransferase [Saccharomonospora azurea]|uniref:N-acetyltransferase n=1 Tax=Saccharomonospora azurea TaxID=40988 RepID=UPI003D8EF378